MIRPLLYQAPSAAAIDLTRKALRTFDRPVSGERVVAVMRDLSPEPVDTQKIFEACLYHGCFRVFPNNRVSLR